jgi:predicted DNA-binding ribbon-helix-helix protein
MKSAVIKRSIVVEGHKTSVSLENEFWDGLREIADQKATTLSTLVGQIDHGRNTGNLSSAIRVFVFGHFRAGNKSGEPGKSPGNGSRESAFPC